MKIKSLIIVLSVIFTFVSCTPKVEVASTEMAIATSTLTLIPPTSTLTPTIIPSPTPVQVYFQELTIPINVYLDSENCIALELSGEEKCVNMFVRGKVGVDNFPTEMTWKGVVYVIGDIDANSVTIEPGTTIYIGANFDTKNLYGKGDDVGCSDSETRTIYKGTKGECGRGLLPNDPHYDEANHISLNITKLISIGTENAPILITSSALKPTMYDWNYLDFVGRIEHTVIEYGRVVAPKFKSTITNSTIAHIGGCNICLDENARDMTITNNYLFDAGHELIDTHHAFNTVIISGNELGATRNAGIVIEGGAPTIKDNVIHDTKTAIVFLGEPDIQGLVISDNTFYNNRHNYYCDGNFNCSPFSNLILMNNIFK